MKLAADLARLRRIMVEEQILARGITDPRILKTMETVPRHKFVPYTKPRDAYGDGPLPIGQGQTISQPYIVAYMTDLLHLDENDKVLEIGTGSGYQAAILSRICREVYTIEIVPHHYVRARKVLEGLKYQNIHLRLGDGRDGWPEEAHFDKIIVTAAARDHVPKPLLKDLVVGGRLVIPIGGTFHEQRLLVYVREKRKFIEETDLAVRFVPLVEGE